MRRFKEHGSSGEEPAAGEPSKEPLADLFTKGEKLAKEGATISDAIPTWRTLRRTSGKERLSIIRSEIYSGGPAFPIEQEWVHIQGAGINAEVLKDDNDTEGPAPRYELTRHAGDTGKSVGEIVQTLDASHPRRIAIRNLKRKYQPR